MTEPTQVQLPAMRTVRAPDGSDVRVLLSLPAGGMAHFELAAGATSIAVRHRTVDEIWYILSGQGQMWRRQAAQQEAGGHGAEPAHDSVIELQAGVCLSIPQGTHFQFRASGTEPLRAIGVTMPRWTGDEEAVLVPGRWQPAGV